MKQRVQKIVVPMLAALTLIFMACPKIVEDPPIVTVTGITDVPTEGTEGKNLTLSGTVTPPDATNQTIRWTVKEEGTTAAGASISGDNTLVTTGAGIVIVTATIADGKAEGTPYTQDFSITIKFVAVTGITEVPTAWTAGESLTLSGTVTPPDATNQTIQWTVKEEGTTAAGASISGDNTLVTTGAGTVIVTAAIADGKAKGTPYSKDFSITINAEFVAVTGITNVPEEWWMAGENLLLSGTVTPENAPYKAITWTVAADGGTGAQISGNTLTTTGPGTVTVTATITNGLGPGTPYTQNFDITINLFVPVTSITGTVDVKPWYNGYLTVLDNYQAVPDNATYKSIQWSSLKRGEQTSQTSPTAFFSVDPLTAVLKATIANGLGPEKEYIQYFSYNSIHVDAVTGVPKIGKAETDLYLSATVMPDNSAFQALVWTVEDPGTTGARLDGDTLKTTGAGTVTVRAAIANGMAPGEDYTDDFSIIITDRSFVWVTGIRDVPERGTTGHLTLSGTITPPDATNKTIQWTVKNAGTTGASIDGDTLRTTGAGTVTVTATIANGMAPGLDYTDDFNITLNPVVPVTGITNVPTEGSSLNDGMLTLTGTVEPGDATYKDIKWTVKDAGTTGAAILRNLMAITGPGTVTVMATITDGLGAGKDYTQDFPITIYGIIPVTNIDIGPRVGSKGSGFEIFVEVEPGNATNKNISWSTLSGSGTVYSTREMTRFTGSPRAGTTWIRATITNGLGENEDYVQDFDFLIE